MRMSEPLNADFARLSEAFDAHQSFWIVSHIQPDPDAVGSQLALALALERQGKRVEIVGRATRRRASPSICRARNASADSRRTSRWRSSPSLMSAASYASAGRSSRS